MRRVLVAALGAFLLIAGLVDDTLAAGRGGAGFRGGGAGFHGGGVGRGFPGRGFVGPGFAGRGHFDRGLAFRDNRFDRGRWVRRGTGVGVGVVGVTGWGSGYGYEEGYGYYDCELGSRLVWNGSEWVNIC